jgi:hypothetical protein
MHWLIARQYVVGDHITAREHYLEFCWVCRAQYISLDAPAEAVEKDGEQSRADKAMFVAAPVSRHHCCQVCGINVLPDKYDWELWCPK